MAVKHTFVSVVPDDADATLVRPSNWNADHAIDNGTVTEAMLSISDNTTGDVSTSAHGFAPKVTNTANFLRGDGTWVNPGTNSGPTVPGGIPMTGVSYPAAYNMNVSTGDTNIYTVPSGKRALVVAAMLMNNSGVGNIVWFPEVKISGTYFRLANNITTANASESNASNIGYIAEAGEIVAVNTATNNAGAVAFQIVEFDNTNAVFAAKTTSLSAGDNTVYTVTAGKTATIFGVQLQVGSVGALIYQNSSGAPRTIIWKFTPSGGSATQIAASASVGNNAKNSAGTFTGGASAGDSIVLNTDAATATQWAWVNVMEI